MTIIGIDPGKSGGLAIWRNGLHNIIKCPKTVEGMSDIIRSSKHSEYVDKNMKTLAYLEQVHAMPHDGRSSLFKFGQNFGQWQGILASYNIETILVSPQKWMKYWKTKLNISLPKDKQERKRVLKEIASRYTDKRVTLYNSDAILIAMYGLYMEQERRKNGSEES
jgi:hypothetical protein|tara:strand:- start:1968 stop:2462 length:495 start_codon:yes stop_codon:yes gene_type:complete